MSQHHERLISVTGLGYVGLPVAVAFARERKVIGFDANARRISELNEGNDRTGEIGQDQLSQSQILFTNNPNDLHTADFHIIAVPTPVNLAKQPDLTSLISASEAVGRILKKNDIVVYESTVYPGTTEEVCAPILEKVSGLTSGIDFFLGYSPERINPGDKIHSFTNIKKVVAGQNTEILEIIAQVYGSVVTAGVHKASSIKVAEAAKVIENTQRDLNIALINELSIIFNKLQIDTFEVLEAAETKWNFLPFKPGLVGGHCIGVDPYYLTYIANVYGVHPEVILAGRRINDNMGKYVAEQTIKQISNSGKSIYSAKIGIFGLTFKENCSDIRNSKVFDIVQELLTYQTKLYLHDPLVNREHLQNMYGMNITAWNELNGLDAIILAVPHQKYLALPISEYINKLNAPKILIDIKGALDKKFLKDHDVKVWRL